VNYKEKELAKIKEDPVKALALLKAHEFSISEMPYEYAQMLMNYYVGYKKAIHLR